MIDRTVHIRLQFENNFAVEIDGRQRVGDDVLETVLEAVLALEDAQDGKVAQAQHQADAELNDQIDERPVLEMPRAVDDVLVEDVQDLQGDDAEHGRRLKAVDMRVRIEDHRNR